MAELSEADKRLILGENYKEVLAKAQEEGRTQSTSRQLWSERVEKCSSNKFSALAIIVVGAVLLVSNFYAVSGPSVMLVGVFAIGALVVGIAWYAYSWMTLRKLRANRPEQ